MMAGFCVKVEFDEEKFHEAIEEFKKNNPDFVEVVRCKDCRYWVENKCCDTGSGYCDNPDGLVNNCCFSQDFCSYGERKEVSE